MASDASTALRNSQAADLVANLDTLEIIDADGTTVLVAFSGLTWSAPSNGQVSVSNTPLTATAAATGTATTARLKDSSGTSGEEITGIPVGTSGTPIVLNTTAISAGLNVDLVSLSYTAPTQVFA